MLRSSRDPGTALGTTPPPRAWRNGWAIGLFLILAILAGGFDLWTKHLAFDRLMDDPSLPGRVEGVFEEYFGTTQPANVDSHTTRWVLQELHLSRRFCFGLSVTLSTNPGVVFGIRWFPLLAVNLITIGMMLFVVGFFLFSESKHYWLHAALALLLGGAFGNLYDRMAGSVVLPHLPPIRYHVRDFIDCGELGYPWVFNLSDAWLVIGAGMIVVYWFRMGRKTRQADAAAKK
ncbi:MAG: signal peptidase II [Phycisphaerae bacterium]|nr:signal peptidase II [Phycisphaerae bacterium]